MTAELMLLAATLATDPCQQAWERARQIRLELGYPGGPETPPEPMDEKICRAILDTPEAELRASMKEALALIFGEPRSSP